MVTRVDREAGVAAFREGRSLCFRLDGALDASMARSAGRMLRGEAAAVRLRLECSKLSGVDGPGARLLASALVAWGAGADGRSVEIHNLDPALARRLAWHPLLSFDDPDELVFFDPDRDPEWGPGAPAARA